MRALPLLCVFLLVLGCASPPTKYVDDPPCHDGWAFDGTSDSKIWNPSNDQLIELYKTIPGGYYVHCWHEMPNGSYAAIISIEENEYRQLDIYKFGTEFIQGFDHEIITVH